ncbi:cellulose-binding domain-containing protein, partial [Plantactinospora sp. S1510]
MLVRRRRTALILTTAAATAALAGVGVITAVSAHAAVGCSVNYSVASQWQGGFGANVTITNLGDPLNGWTLRWSYSAGQQVTQAWNATVTQSGSQVTATNVGYNGNIGTNGTASFGFNGTWNSSNPAPGSFSVNNVACTGAVSY